MIKHISFDFWDTLFKGNPEFYVKQMKYLSEYFDADETWIQSQVNKTKRFTDGISEETLYCIDSKTQIWHFCQSLKSVPSVSMVNELYHEFEKLFIESPPIQLFETEFIEELINLPISTSISCNTGFYSGEMIQSFLKQNKFNWLFRFQLFSDEIGFFKPNPFFAYEIKKQSKREYDEILHVGDNLNTDGKLCELSGMKFLHVENKNPNFNLIFDYLK